MEYKHFRVERGSIDREIKTETSFSSAAAHTNTRMRARPLRDRKVELSLDQYHEKMGKRGQSRYASIVLSRNQALALLEVIQEALAQSDEPAKP